MGACPLHRAFRKGDPMLSGLRRCLSAPVVALVALGSTLALATPVAAVPVLADTYHGLTPARLLETRVGLPTIDGEFQGGGAVGAGATLELTVVGRGGVPVSGVGAVALNVAVTGASLPSFVTVFPSGASRPTAASVNFVAGETVSNMVIAKVGAGGRVSIYNLSGSVDVVVDVLGWFPAASVPASTARVSVRPDGTASSGGDSFARAISDDGRFVAFESTATDLVADDTNTASDVFLRDLVAGTTSRISVSSSGAQAIGGDSIAPSISADGRYVVFHSAATNLVGDDSNGRFDVFLRDTATNTTTRISLSNTQAEAVNGDSVFGDISGDGRYVAFLSDAGNLVAADDNGQFDVFVRDLQASTTTRVSVASGGGQATGGASAFPSISFDGRYVAFESKAVDLVAGDTNAQSDVFLHDVVAGTTIRVSVRSDGAQGEGGESTYATLSDDGRYVAFESSATNLVSGDSNGRFDAMIHDVVTGVTSRISVSTSGAQAVGNDSLAPSITSDGRYVAFHSGAANLVPNDTNGHFDVFVRDLATGTTSAVSVGASGAVASGGDSTFPAITPDGRHVVFKSAATDLVAGGEAGSVGIFVRDVGTN